MTDIKSINIKDALLMTAVDSVATKMKVGAILIKAGKVVQFGYNRAPEGFAIEDENGETIDQNAIHAEVDVIYRTNPDDLVGAELYCTHSPCKLCALSMKYVGIKSIHYLEENTRSSAYSLSDNPLNLNLFKL